MQCIGLADGDIWQMAKGYAKAWPSLYKVLWKGDSKSRLSVQNVYESVGRKVEKLECIGHVQKRMGTALRKFKREK